MFISMSRRSAIVSQASERVRPTMTESWLDAPTQRRSWVGVCVCAIVRECARAYVRACVRACVFFFFRISSSRLILLTRSVGAMHWSKAQLRRGQLRMVVDVGGQLLMMCNHVFSCLFWLATLTCCTVRQSTLLHESSVSTDASSQSV